MPTELFQEGAIAALDPKLERLMQLCGIKEFPAVHTKVLPLERVTLQDDVPVKPSPGLIRSISLLGIRQPPSVAFLTGTAWDAEDATYIVVMGRRRTLSARHLLAKGDIRFRTIKCEVYEWNAPMLGALFAMIENNQRSEAWVQDVIHLRMLVHSGVAMTLDDLAAYGFKRTTIKARLEIALLPDPILDQICQGSVSWHVAKQLLRLTITQRDRLEKRVVDGESITAEMVNNLLKRQINAGLGKVHFDLSQAWQESASSCNVAADDASLSNLLTILLRCEPLMRQDSQFQRMDSLSRILIKELEIVLRQRTVVSQEGVQIHV